MRWFLGMRVLVIGLFLGGAILFQHNASAGHFLAVPRYLYLLVAVAYAQTLFSVVLVRYFGSTQWLVQLQIGLDLLFATALIHVTGGIESLFASFYILIILGAVLLLSRRDVLIVAAAAAILYGGLVNLQYYRLIPTPPGFSGALDVGGEQVLYSLFVNICAFLLVGILGGLLVNSLRFSEHVRRKITIDYEELERLNRAILANMTSGLIIVDRRLHIRSINAAAQEMLGVSFESVYNGDLARFFPGLELLRDGQFRVVSRGEGRLVDSTGSTRPVGFNTSLLTDFDQAVDGLLVTFQDLTNLKKMEERLKRTDRLAAVGQLAAGLAHEIRNPLASISGSVQLLRENRALGAEDLRLMDIVVREADRLNGLLREFLVYARPAVPDKTWIGAAELVCELIDLCAGDGRFNAIEMVRSCPAGGMLHGDRNQLRQALWNLLINAAEAMPNGGKIGLSYCAETRRLEVADSGPGVPEALRQKIYDPFFTTKDHGTGLGLATVHAIVEAHGGTLELQSSPWGGAKFVIGLPLSRQTGSACSSGEAAVSGMA